MTDSKSKLFNDDLIEANKGTDILFEQYKLYVQLADKISERRQSANTFFLSLNSILIAGLTAFLTQVGSPQINCNLMLIAIIAAGVVACITWRRLIQSYGQLNAGRFEVIHLLERRLPARLFDYEWDILEQGKGKRYKPFTETEVNVPLVFVGIYALIAIYVAAQVFLL